MCGMGSSRLALKHPELFGGVAAIEPGIEPILHWKDMQPRRRFWRGDYLSLRQIPIKSAPQAYRFTSIVAMKTCSCYLKAASFCIVFCMTPVSSTNTIWSVAQTISAAQSGRGLWRLCNP